MDPGFAAPPSRRPRCYARGRLLRAGPCLAAIVVLAAMLAACGGSAAAAKRTRTAAPRFTSVARPATAREVLNPPGSVPTLAQLMANFAVLRRPRTEADRAWKPNCSCAGAARQLDGLTRFAVRLPHGYRVFMDVEQFTAGGQDNAPAGSYSLNLDIVDRYGNALSTSFGPNTGYTVRPLSTARPGSVAAPAHGGAVYASLVPDGVASVSWTFGCARGRGGARASARRTSETVNPPVVNNVAAIWLAKPPVDCPGATTVLWRSATGQVITRFSGYGNLPAPPFVAGRLGRGTRRLLGSSGVGVARIGESSEKAVNMLTALLGPPADVDVKLQGCAASSETVWTSPSVADPLSVFFRGGRLVGYRYGSTAQEIGLTQGPGALLETARGLTLGVTVGAAERMYPKGFVTSVSHDFGHWSAESGGGRLSGLALPRSYPAHRVAADDLVAALGAGTAVDCVPTIHVSTPVAIPVPGQHASAQARALYYEQLALRHARASGACPRPAAPPATAGGPLDPALLSVLAVLREPRAKADELPRGLRGKSNPAARFTAYIRFARSSAGVSYYLVPTASGSRIGLGLSPRCLPAIASALHAEASKIPASVRAATLALTARAIRQERETAARQAGDQVCLLFAGHALSGGTCGANASDIRQWGLVSMLGPVSGVVPDGVATVTLSYRAYEGNPAVTVTAKVVNNVFVTTITRPRATRGVPPTMVWRSASGGVLKTLHGYAAGVATSGWCGGTGGC